MANQSYNPLAFAATGGGVSVAFKYIETAGQTTIEADNTTDTLRLSAMGGFAIEHHISTDTIILSGTAAEAFNSSALAAASSNWNVTYTDMSTNSAKWDSTNTDVNANSANWNYVASNSAHINAFDVMMITEVFR